MINKIREFADNSKTIRLARENVEDMPLAKEVAMFIILFALMILIQSIVGMILIFPISDYNSPLYLIGVFLSFISIPVIIYVYLEKIEKRDFRSIGLCRENIITSTLMGLTIGFLMFSIVVVIGVLLGQFTFNGFDLSSVIYLIPFLLAFAIQSFGEEIYTRGWTLTSFSRRHGIITAMLINSIVFVMPHLTNNGIDAISIVNLFLFGIFFAVMLLRFDNLWICGGAHTAWNFSQGLIYGFNVSGIDTPSLFKFSQVGENIINGGVFGPESSLIATVVVILSIIIVVYYKNNCMCAYFND
ncbi:MAG: type II CAAX endopeptidase family protein [Methanosphaera sp.]|nr:type II CAAX endopeptidase family protein [Methanosphaera sp.]